MGGRLFYVLALVVATATPARADDPEPEIEMEPDAPQPANDPKAARKWLTTAQQLVQKGDAFTARKKPDDARTQYENARTAFQNALDASGDVNLRYDLGLVEEKLGRIPEAARHVRAVVKAASGARPDVLKKATAKFDELATKVGQLTLVAKPPEATITLDTVVVGTGALAEPLILAPGTYKFAVAADGFQSKEIEIALEAGSESERTIELEPVKIIIEAPVVPDESDKPPPPPPPPSRLPLYLGGGAAIGLVTVGAITGVLALNQHGAFTADDASRGERDDARTAGKRLARITDGAFAGAVVATLFTVYWYRFQYRPALRAYAEQSKVAVAPWVEGESGGLAVLGRF